MGVVMQTPKARPTMHDVAEAAGVSLKTVSRVVNDEARVDERTRARVNAAIRTLGFRRNDLARSLRRGQASSTIGLVIEDIANPFYSHIARGVVEVAQRYHYMVITGSPEEQMVIMGSVEERGERERDLVLALLRRRVEGLLIVPTGVSHSYLLPEMELGTPVVFLDRPPQQLTADAILLDNRGGAHRGVEHLLAQGHRRIGFIGGNPAVYTGAERLMGYREALNSHEIAFDEALVRLRRYDALQAESAMHELLALPEPPTAVFADNNRMSVGVLRALHMQAARIALVGFDDIELADMLPLPITVVTHDATTMGHQAADLLFARLRHDDRPPQQLVIPTQLLVRGSGEVSPLH